ncbi:HD domain-containing protein [Paenibacillus guangzhouensis]|uniref:HD domain-containing protein n=1 Tax=Paenibacillus guangzhouensis TaxID=1473112 RepID=UPI0012669419|nr:HD domain-containing protein [Paenibacillus guangzhouensis]
MPRRKEHIIELAEQFAREFLTSDPSGHDWWHVHRVRSLALEIAEREHADAYICELAALLHDVADVKLNASKQEGLDRVRIWLEDVEEDPAVISHVMDIIANMSYNEGRNAPLTTIEGQVVQDADRLDAIGAVGIARTFAYAGSRGHLMHEPGDQRTNTKTAIAHFYEKLLKLQGLMNTDYARTLAAARHQFMETFLQQFHAEWPEVKEVYRTDDS